jgi:hypothetical protein
MIERGTGVDETKLFNRRIGRVMFLTQCYLVLVVVEMLLSIMVRSQFGAATPNQGQLILGVLAARATRYATFLTLVVYLLNGVLFLIMLYRTCAQARTFKSPFADSAGWAVACWFIPIVSLFEPFVVMKAILRSSAISTGASEAEVKAGDTLVIAWWATLMVRIVASVAVLVMVLTVHSNALQGIAKSFYWLAVSQGLGFIAGTLFLLVLYRLRKGHTAALKDWDPPGVLEPVPSV